jgi:hypothetical protein
MQQGVVAVKAADELPHVYRHPREESGGRLRSCHRPMLRFREHCRVPLSGPPGRPDVTRRRPLSGYQLLFDSPTLQDECQLEREGLLVSGARVTAVAVTVSELQ